MMLWIIFAAMMTAALVLLLLPLFRKQTALDKRVDYDIVIYRDQLAEVEKDLARGLLSENQVEAARTEILRRMLAAEDAEALATGNDKPRGSMKTQKITAVAIVAFLSIGAFLMYHSLGAPELVGKPYADRAKNDPDFAVAADAEQLMAKLKENPDAKGFKQLGDSFVMLKRYEDAAGAYHRAIELGTDNAGIWSELGESIVLASDGGVPPEALDAFMKALKHEPRDARARFYIGLAKADANNPKEAVAIWRDLLSDSPADAPWTDMIKEHIAKYSKAGGFDSETINPAAPTVAPIVEKVSPVDAMENKAAADAIMAAPPEQQNDMIKGMVAKLEEKLKQNPDDLQGWEMLSRSYKTLGETKKAEDADKKIAELKAGGAKPKEETDKASMATAIMAAPPAQQNDMIKGMVAKLEEKLKKNPDDLQGWEMLSRSYKTLGEAKKAEDADKKIAGLKASGVKPVEVKTPSADANANPHELKKDKIKLSINELQAGLKKTPNDVPMWLKLAHSYQIIGEFAKALEAVNHAESLKPKDVEVKLSKAEIQLAAAPRDAKTLPADFIVTMRELLAIEPEHVDALYYVGEAEREAGNTEAARTMWKKALLGLPADSKQERADLQQQLDDLPKQNGGK